MTTQLQYSKEWRNEDSDNNDLALRSAVVDLARLLKCMTTNEAPPDLSWQSLEGRAKMAQDLLRTIQELWHSSTYENESARAEDETRLMLLQEQVEQACKRAREIAAERKANQVDIIQEIFFPNKQSGNDTDVHEEEKKDTTHEEEQDDANEPAAHESQQPLSRPAQPRQKSSAQDVQELQKAQREQLEAEISHMAARLKESTKHMNTTLRAQTEELGEMEDLATKNVEKVGNVADNVTQHNRKSWKSTLATWTVLFAVLGSFAFCFMTIRMVPKQRNKCLFFCGTTSVQKEVCNTMEDGSIVCVNIKGSPYVKKAAPVSRQESEDVEREMECELDDDGECLVQSSEELNERQQQQEDNIEDADACSEEGECTAEYQDEPDSTSEQIEEPENDTERDEPVLINGVLEDRGHREALDQVTSHSENASTSDEIAKEGHRSENPDEDPADVENIPRKGTDEFDVVPGNKEVEGDFREEHAEAQERADTESVDNEPVNEPAVEDTHQKVYKENEPTMERSHEPDTEAIFKPAEISTLHERFDDDNMDEHVDYTFLDAQYAASRGERDLLDQILHQKPHFASMRDGNGWQLIHEACRFGHLEVLRMLLDDYEADINSRVGLVPDGPSPLFLAYNAGNDESSEVAHFLESRGGVSIAGGEDAPYRAASEHTPEELEQYNVKDLNVAAATGDDILVAQYIVARPDLLSASDENGWFAIHEAVRFKRERIIQLLINAGVDINARTGHDHQGWSPLGLSLRMLGEENEVTQLLLRYDAEIYFPNKE